MVSNAIESRQSTSMNEPNNDGLQLGADDLSPKTIRLLHEARVWQSSAAAVAKTSDFTTALCFYRNAQAKIGALTVCNLHAELHINAGCVLSKLGDSVAAKGEFASALLVLQRLLGPSARADLLQLAQWNYDQTGREIHAAKARKLLHEANEHLSHRAHLSARTILHEALTYAEHGAQDPILQAQLLNQIAWTYAGEGDHTRGISILRGARRLLSKPDLTKNEGVEKLLTALQTNLKHFRTTRRQWPVWQLLEKSKLLMSQGLFEQAEAAATEAMAACRERVGADHPAMGYAMHDVAVCQTMLGEYDGAQRHFKCAKVLMSKWPQHHNALEWIL